MTVAAVIFLILSLVCAVVGKNKFLPAFASPLALLLYILFALAGGLEIRLVCALGLIPVIAFLLRLGALRRDDK